MAVVSLLAGCVADAGPPGGVKPELGAVPDLVPPRYDAYERAVLEESLEAAGAATRAEAGVADARIAGTPAPDAPALVPRRIAPPPPPRESRRAADVDLDEDLVGALSFLRLVDAAQRDRAELARLTAALDDIEAEPPSLPERVTVLSFAPGSVDLESFEEQRLALAIANVEPAPEWRVSTGGPGARERAAAVVAALQRYGIERSSIITINHGRDVAVAEVAIRR